MSDSNANCKIDTEYCSCQMNGKNTIIKLDCTEKTNQVFLNNLYQIKETYNFSRMIDLNIRNKLIKNISNSSVRHLLSINLKKLSINDCGIKSIQRGLFNFMLQISNQ